MEITTSSLTIGHIKQKCHCYPVFQVCDSNENTVLEIKGPVCPISCFGNVDFEVILHPLDFSGLHRRTIPDPDPDRVIVSKLFLPRKRNISRRHAGRPTSGHCT